MALDDFMDLDSDPETDSSNDEKTEDNSHESPLKDFDSYKKTSDGDWESYGHLSFQTTEEWRQTIVGSMEKQDGLVKYSLPAFPHIQHTKNSECDKKRFESGKRYKIDGSIKNFSCFSCGVVKLSSIPRELIMIDVGEVKKDKCMDKITDRIDEEVNKETKVELLLFANTTHLIKLAIADSLVDSWKAMADVETAKAILMEDNANTVVGDKTDEEHVSNEYHIEPW